jgi:hypothetical protein
MYIVMGQVGVKGILKREKFTFLLKREGKKGKEYI